MYSRVVVVLTLSSVLLAGCGTELEAAGALPRALDTDPVKACAIPEKGNIPGHESEFYECAESFADFGQGCGPDGYLLGYGTRYARRFHQVTRPGMSTRGQRWIDDVLVCLQRDLRSAIDESTSCDAIWEIAFDSHPACYVEAGFCTLSPTDLLKVVWSIDAREWFAGDAARQAVETARQCGGQYAFLMRLFFSHLLD
jgi:hypothetical protein